MDFDLLRGVLLISSCFSLAMARLEAARLIPSRRRWLRELRLLPIALVSIMIAPPPSLESITSRRDEVLLMPLPRFKLAPVLESARTSLREELLRTEPPSLESTTSLLEELRLRLPLTLEALLASSRREELRRMALPAALFEPIVELRVTLLLFGCSTTSSSPPVVSVIKSRREESLLMLLPRFSILAP